MAEETSISADLRDSLQLTISEPKVSLEKPWQDDELGREQIAKRLTNLIRNQQRPFIISIDGQWGTGKTFLLKRWQKELEGDGFRAIYYNAWEDDFCDDPLLSIIGQLSEYFKEKIDEDIDCQIVQAAVQLLDRSALVALTQAMGVEVRVHDVTRSLLEEYRDKCKTKADLRKYLTEMSLRVTEDTNCPLVFIIDELDRCRPTFAIDLLERVKHIFDVPNMVFVFGVNRDELLKSLQSVYGEIDADIYLRRFFDMELSLPEANAKAFCTHIMNRFGLHEFFQTKSSDPFTPANRTDYRNLSQALPTICSLLKLSLRDMVYCISTVALAIRNLGDDQDVYPWALGVLIPLKISDPARFRQFIQGDCQANDVIDFIDEKLSFPIQNRKLNFELTAIESELYLLETARLTGTGGSTPWQQLDSLSRGSESTNHHLLSTRTQNAGAERASELLNSFDEFRLQRLQRNAIDELAELIDLHSFVRR